MPTSGNTLTITKWASDGTFVFDASNPFVSGDVGGTITVTGGHVYSINAVFLAFNLGGQGTQNAAKLLESDDTTEIDPAALASPTSATFTPDGSSPDDHTITKWASDGTFVFDSVNPFTAENVGGTLTVAGGHVYTITSVLIAFDTGGQGTQNLAKLNESDGTTEIDPAALTSPTTGTFAPSGAPAPLASGTATISADSTGITASVAAATGGTSPYSYPLERTLNKAFGSMDAGVASVGTYPARTHLDPVSGIDSRWVYWYRWKPTDADAATTYSNALPATIPAVLPTPGGATPNETLVILNIGDSNTALVGGTGNTTNVGTKIGDYLVSAWGVSATVVVNRAIGGSGPAQWQEDASENYLVPAVAAAVTAYNAVSGPKRLVLDLNHGTNFVGTVEEYTGYITAISNYCLSQGVHLVVLSGSIYLHTATGTGGAGETQHREELMRQYRAALSSIANGTTIKVGDQYWSYKATGIQPALVSKDNDIHLTDAGVAVVAQLRARGIAAAAATATESGDGELTVEQDRILRDLWAYQIGPAQRTDTGDIYKGPDGEDRFKISFPTATTRTVTRLDE